MKKKIISITTAFAFLSCGDGPSVILNTTSASASSTLASSANYAYEAKNALDGNPATAWVEGVKGDGLGESLQVTFDGKAKVKEFAIINGFAENHASLGDLYPLNNRVKKLRIVFDDGEESVDLRDGVKELQTIKFAKPHESMGAKIVISEVYKGSKWDDTVVSEIQFIGAGKGKKIESSGPATGGENKPTLLKVGTTGKTEKFEITLISVSTKGYVGQYVADTLMGEKAPEGATFIAISYKLKNISKEPIGAFSVPSVKLVSPEGTKYDENAAAGVFYKIEQKMDEKILSDINPSITIRTGTIFEVAKELWQKKGWKIIFDADSDIEYAAN